MSDPWRQRLSEYLDGELTLAEREELEAHLAGCADCVSLLVELREVVDRARTLEDHPPAEDLWPAITARIAPADPAVAGTIRPVTLEPRPGVSHERPRSVLPPLAALVGGTGHPGPLPPQAPERRRLAFSVPQLAAAAVALMLISGGALWLARWGPLQPLVVPPLADSTSMDAGMAVRPATAPADFGGPGYGVAVVELERALEAGRGRLSPETLRTLEKNLRIIDRAIDDARRALAADPGNVYLSGHLAATMRRKLDLLRRASEIAGART